MRSKANAVDYSWLGQFDTQGPFLSLPVVKSVWPNGIDRLGDTDDRATAFKQAYADWLRAYDGLTLETRDDYAEITHAWIDTVLDELAGWDDLRMRWSDEPGANGSGPAPRSLEIHSPGEQIRVRPDGALEGRGSAYAVLLRIVEPSDDLRGPGLDGWSASQIDRMAELLREAEVEIGIVTDGRWWAIVWAHRDKPTGSAISDAATWGEEPLVRDAFLTLIDQRRFRAKDVDDRLPKLLERSELEAEDITEALGTQVRKAVELLVGSFSRHRLEALAAGDPDPLPEKDDDVYQAAVTVMMRVVFLLFAEERGMLPTEPLYWRSYAITDVLDDLRKRAAQGEELLDETYDAWHRLLAVSNALHGGVNYDEMRMPAYGGSLLDPGRFPWLSAAGDKGLRITVPDRVMLHVLKSVQYANVGKEARRISFRDIDVEQIGYIYEGLLGYTCTTVKGSVVIGLHGKDGEEPEIDVTTLQKLFDGAKDGKAFAKSVREWVKERQPSAKPATVAQIAKKYDLTLSDEQRAQAIRQLTPIVATAGRDSDGDLAGRVPARDERVYRDQPAANSSPDLLDLLVNWSPLIRRDLRGIPFVVPVGGLVVTETPSRKHSGAHYTPRSLAEEVVQHALEPLVYEPGPLQENDRDKWKLKGSTTILDLKVADIAVGSGAFLVAAARFLASHVVEAWTAEDAISPGERAKPDRAYERALREVIARCLYGADINPMAVEMCKLSLWLVSLDPSKPFSFVDDKIFCGNSLLGVIDLDQLRHLHIYPDDKQADLITQLVDVDAKLDEATRLRRELVSTVDENDPMRSSEGKKRLLRQAKDATAELRDIADGIIAAGLPHGGKPGKKLDGAYSALAWALAGAYLPDRSEGDRLRLDQILDRGLTPTVDTDYERWKPTHWVIEAPDVFVVRGGFDAVVGNPPFLGARDIGAAVGNNVHEWIANLLAGGLRGRADLVAFFFKRSVGLLRRNGVFGLIGTDSVGEGDTRRVGLEQMLEAGCSIIRAVPTRHWPASSATVDVATIWGVSAGAIVSVDAVLNGDYVTSIASDLQPAGRLVEMPYPLRDNNGIAFQGCILSGDGFLIDADTASRWKHVDSRYSRVVRRYLNAEDLVNRPTCDASRWVIDFADMSQSEASLYRAAFDRVANQVREERQSAPRAGMRLRWWQYQEVRPGMRKSLAPLRSAIVIPLMSKYSTPVRVATDQVFSNRLAVVTLESFADLAGLSSACHVIWSWRFSTTRGDRLSYSLTEAFRTYVRPPATSRLESVGRVLDQERSEVMLRRELGLTKLYNLLNNPEVQDDTDVDRIREIHVEVDEATMEAYGWDDLSLDHGFHTYRRMERWTVSPTARIEILDRLLELNHERARAEGQHVPDQEGSM